MYLWRKNISRYTRVQIIDYNYDVIIKSPPQKEALNLDSYTVAQAVSQLASQLFRQLVRLDFVSIPQSNCMRTLQKGAGFQRNKRNAVCFFLPSGERFPRQLMLRHQPNLCILCCEARPTPARAISSITPLTTTVCVMCTVRVFVCEGDGETERKQKKEDAPHNSFFGSQRRCSGNYLLASNLIHHTHTCHV